MPEVKESEYAIVLVGWWNSSYVLAMSDVQKTDSCGYEEERFDESGLARQTAEAQRKRREPALCSHGEYFGIVADVMYNIDAERYQSNCIRTWMQRDCKAYKRLLFREGADEFFGGYNMYQEMQGNYGGI